MKILLFILVICSFCCSSNGCLSSSWKSAQHFVLKPKYDGRSFKTLILKNQINVLLIKDESSEKAGFTVGVKVGSLNDPINAFGLFHLIEHMLFLGTGKHSNPQDYDEFMAQHGGRNNAYTSEERTIFFNEIGEEFLEEGLDYFSHFFIDPLFDEKMVNKEINAVNSEHLKNIPNELDRLWHTIRSYTYPPMSHFTTGNKETLSEIPKSMGISIQKLIKEMFTKYYCGKNMFVVLSSKRSLIEQEKLISEYFSVISSDNDGICVNASSIIGPEFSQKSIIKENYLGKLLHVKPLRTGNLLWLIWSFPIRFISINKQPLLVLSYILNSKHSNSLYWLLQKKNYVTDSSSMYENYSFGSIFIYKLELTVEGSKNQVDLIGTIYKYINKLRESKELLHVYQEIKSLTEREFDTQLDTEEKSPMYATSEICSRFIQYGVHNVLSGDVLIKEADERLIFQILNYISPFNTLFLSCSENGFKDLEVKEDKYYNVKHTIEKIPIDLLHSWKNGKFDEATNIEVKIPIPERCSPINERVSKETEKSRKIQKLNSSIANIWWHGPIIGSNSVGIRILLKFPRRYSKGIETQVWGELITFILDIQLEEKIERYIECGIDFNTKWDIEGIVLEIKSFGYSKDLETLLTEVVAPSISKISDINCESLNKFIGEITGSNKGFDSGTDTTYSKILLLVKALQYSDEYTEWEHRNFLNEKYKYLLEKDTRYNGSIKSFLTFYANKLTGINSSNDNQICQTFKNWSYKLLHRLSVVAYIQGNVSKKNSLQLIEEFILSSNILPLNEKYSMTKKVHKIIKPVDLTLINPVSKDENNTVLILYQFGVPTFEERIHLMAIEPILQGYVYDNLRTKKQLGYITLANIMPIGNTRSLVIGVEGDSNYSVESIQMNIQETLHEFSLKVLGNMGIRTFDNIKRTLSQEIKSIESSFIFTLNYNWDEIRLKGDHLQSFNSTRALDYINNKITINQLYNTFNKLVNSDNKMKPISIIKIEYFHNAAKESRNQKFIDNYMTSAVKVIRESFGKNYYE
ncbi:sporozoite developmental protein [Cryptosporidium felis]|nr:sporozoite developmental protein [Cryptosporidium felis]